MIMSLLSPIGFNVSPFQLNDEYVCCVCGQRVLILSISAPPFLLPRWCGSIFPVQQNVQEEGEGGRCVCFLDILTKKIIPDCLSASDRSCKL